MTIYKNDLKITLDILTVNYLQSWERCTNDTIIQTSGKQYNLANMHNKLEKNNPQAIRNCALNTRPYSCISCLKLVLFHITSIRRKQLFYGNPFSILLRLIQQTATPKIFVFQSLRYISFCTFNRLWIHRMRENHCRATGPQQQKFHGIQISSRMHFGIDSKGTSSKQYLCPFQVTLYIKNPRLEMFFSIKLR